MRIMVTGGRGTFGRLLVPKLTAGGAEVVITTRQVGADGSDRLELDLRGEIDPSVLAGVDVVVHAATDPARTKAVDVEGTRRLLVAAHRAGLPHFAYLSIVGIDGHPFRYYRAKAAAEQLIEASGVPYTIFRATQFHEFLDRIFSTGPVVTVFPEIEFQVIDGGVVADRMVDLVESSPGGRVADLGGPASEPMSRLADLWKRSTRSRKPKVTVPVFGRAARAFRDRLHHTPNRAEGTPTFADWLDARYQD